MISIIGTLAALLLPSLARGKRHTQVIVCLNNLRQVGISIENFLQDNQKYPRGLGGREAAPEFACGTPEWVRLAEMTNRPLADYIPPYSQTWHCPEDKGFNFLPQGPFFGPTLHYAFGCSYKLNVRPCQSTISPGRCARNQNFQWRLRKIGSGTSRSWGPMVCRSRRDYEIIPCEKNQNVPLEPGVGL